jgi:hypothetical protein
MSETRKATPAGSAGTEDIDWEPRTGWVGWIVFASVIMIMVGSFQAFMGFVGLFQPGYYLVDRHGLAVPVDYTVWGWVHLILGVLTIAVALGMLVGQTWARVMGVILGIVLALVNITFINAYPLWITMLITLDVLVIYSLVVHGREMRSYRDEFDDVEGSLPASVRPGTSRTGAFPPLTPH